MIGLEKGENWFKQGIRLEEPLYISLSSITDQFILITWNHRMLNHYASGLGKEIAHGMPSFIESRERAKMSMSSCLLRNMLKS